MATFVVLASFTEQGIRSAKETINRADQFKEMAKKNGVTVKDMYLDARKYDMVTICDAPDDETATALLLSVSRAAFVRSRRRASFRSPT